MVVITIANPLAETLDAKIRARVLFTQSSGNHFRVFVSYIPLSKATSVFHSRGWLLTITCAHTYVAALVTHGILAILFLSRIWFRSHRKSHPNSNQVGKDLLFG